MGRFGYNTKRNQLPYSKEKARVIAKLNASAKQELSKSGYRPLPARTPCIRLLKILSCSPENDYLKPRMVCLLQTYRLDSKVPEFAALSYAWGCPFTDSPASYLREVLISVKVHPRKAEYECYISHNLYEALLEVHRRRWQSHLWVDSVCINQSDQEEKASQVQMMGGIYSRAAKTIAWLGRPGPEKADIEYLFGPFCRFLCDWQQQQQQREQREQQQHGHGDGDGDAQFPEISSMPPPWPVGATEISFTGSDMTVSARQIAALLRFNRRVRYLTRLWTIQEIALSREVVFLYGSSVLPSEGHLLLPRWLDASYATVRPLELVSAEESLLGESDRRLATPGTRIALRIRKWVEALHRDDASSRALEDLQDSLFGARCPKTRRLAWLERLLAMTVTLNCTDERDHYYALLGLMGLVEPSVATLRPDYGISIENLLRNLSAELLTGLPYMTAFGLLPIHHLRNLNGLPSWVVDLTTQFESTDEWIGGLQGRLMSNGQKTPSDAFPFRNDSNSAIQVIGDTLRVQGTYCGRIEVVHELQHNSDTGQDINHDRVATIDELIKIFSLALHLPPETQSSSTHILEAIAMSSSLCPSILMRDLPGTTLPAFWAAPLMIPTMASHVLQSATDASTSDNSSNNSSVAPSTDIKAKAIASLSRARTLFDSLQTRNLLPEEATRLLSNETELSALYAAGADEELTDWDRAALSYLGEVSSLIGRRAMVVTENGLVGSVPRGAKRGDELWLLCRARVPVVLRPKRGEEDEEGDEVMGENEDGSVGDGEGEDESGSDGENGFTVLGEAYIHGGMQGELVQRGLAGETRWLDVV